MRTFICALLPETCEFIRNLIRRFQNSNKVIPKFFDPDIRYKYYDSRNEGERDENLHLYYRRLKGKKKEKAKNMILEYLSHWNRHTIIDAIEDCRVLEIKEALPILQKMLANLDEEYEGKKKADKERIEFAIKELSKQK